MPHSSDHPTLLQNIPNVQKSSDSGTKDSCALIKQYMVVMVMVNFIVKYTKTKNIYTANTFVTKICIKNKSRHGVKGPITLTVLHILPSSSLPPEEASGLIAFPTPFFIFYNTWLLFLNQIKNFQHML